VNRCMKARKSSRVGCGCYVLRGQLIVNRGGTRWICLPCAIAAIASERPAETGRHSQQKG
jgi:hypothetical protein